MFYRYFYGGHPLHAPRWRARDQAQGVQGVRPDAVAAVAMGQAPGDESDGFITPIAVVYRIYRWYIYSFHGIINQLITIVLLVIYRTSFHGITNQQT